MGRRLAAWRALEWRARGQLIVCAAALPIIHLALALLGYRRTRRVIEALSHRRASRDASPGDLAKARGLARLAAIAGRHGAVQATCLRQSLLVYGWLRLRRLQPALRLGIRPDVALNRTADSTAPQLQAHAWVELQGTRLLPSDEGHVAFHEAVP